MKIARIAVVAACLIGSAAIYDPRGACADAPDVAPADQPNAPPDRAALRRELGEITAPGPYFDLLATLMFGDGLRFNNPYRLAHQLGGSGESLSSTAPYFDFGIGAAMGKADGLQHGARLGLSIAAGGVPQQVVTPAYQAIVRFGPSWLLYGWAGLPIIVSPDPNVGAEIAAGGAWFARAGLGLTAAVIADGFYGAGTRERSAVLYPVVSAQAGLLVAYEVLP